MQGGGFFHGRVADTVFLAALVSGVDSDQDCFWVCSGKGEGNFCIVEKDLGISEIFIVMEYARRDSGCAELDVTVCGEFEVVPIEIVAGLNSPTQSDLIGSVHSAV